MSNWIHEGFLFLHSRELMSKTSQLVHVTMPITKRLKKLHSSLTNQRALICTIFSNSSLFHLSQFSFIASLKPKQKIPTKDPRRRRNRGRSKGVVFNIRVPRDNLYRCHDLPEWRGINLILQYRAESLF